MSTDLSGFNCRSLLFAQDNFQNKLVELTTKLTSNDLISTDSKVMVNQTTELLKEQLGVSDYFKAVTQFEGRRRKLKEEGKVRLAEMAILAPENFAAEKSGKKRKLE